MKKIIFILFGMVILLSLFVGFAKTYNKKAAQTSQQGVSSSHSSQHKTIKSDAIAIIAENLDTPWAIAFLPDKSILVTERVGRVRLIDSNGSLQDNPIGVLNKVKEFGEGGLLGITLHPNFSTNHYVYLYYTFSNTGDNTRNRVVRMTYDNKKLSEEQIIVDNIPGATFHNGGRIKFGPDGYLYITTGDAQEPSQAQEKNSLAGKILRVTDTGEKAPGNPFNNLVYSYGHRNPQGIAWDSTGQLWETEHGRSNPTGFDEVNLIESGKNYGWEIIQGDEEKNGMETPKINSGPTTSWAPAGAAFLGNSFFFAGLKGQTLYESVIQNSQVVELKKHLVGEYGRLREVVVGPDGMIYITTSNNDGRGQPDSTDDKVIRINPEKL